MAGSSELLMLAERSRWQRSRRLASPCSGGQTTHAAPALFLLTWPAGGPLRQAQGRGGCSCQRRRPPGHGSGAHLPAGLGRDCAPQGPAGGEPRVWRQQVRRGCSIGQPWLVGCLMPLHCPDLHTPAPRSPGFSVASLQVPADAAALDGGARGAAPRLPAPAPGSAQDRDGHQHRWVHLGGRCACVLGLAGSH